jgi:hypothetical protein
MLDVSDFLQQCVYTIKTRHSRSLHCCRFGRGAMPVWRSLLQRQIADVILLYSLEAYHGLPAVAAQVVSAWDVCWCFWNSNYSKYLFFLTTFRLLRHSPALQGVTQKKTGSKCFRVLNLEGPKCVGMNAKIRNLHKFQKVPVYQNSPLKEGLSLKRGDVGRL